MLHARSLARGLRAVGLRSTADVAEVTRGSASLADGERRAACLATLRSSSTPAGNWSTVATDTSWRQRARC